MLTEILALFPLLANPVQEAQVGATAVRSDEARLAARVSDERARKAVRELVAFGPRMGGTASGKKAAEWLKGRFEAAGLSATIVLDDEQWCHSEEAWRVVAHVAGEESAIELASAWPYGYSPTAKGRARLALEDDAGAALLVSKWGRRAQPKAAAVVLVDGVTTRDGSYPRVLHLGKRADNPYPVFGLSRTDGARLRAWLAAEREIEVEFSLVAESKAARPQTVIATLPARDGAPPGYLLYCAHGDSDAGGPGADDNASGEAVLLEIATAWAQAIRAGEVSAPPREVRFAVWGSEIASTRAFLRDRVTDSEPILGVINYDQAGFGSGAEQLNLEPDDVVGNRGLIHELLAVLADFDGTSGFPKRWATNKSLGGTDSYVFSGSKLFREKALPALTLFTSAWGEPNEQPRTEGMPGESWSDRDLVNVDYDLYYHSAGDTPENTTDKEPWNMGWCARVGLLGGRRWLATLTE